MPRDVTGLQDPAYDAELGDILDEMRGKGWKQRAGKADAAARARDPLVVAMKAGKGDSLFVSAVGHARSVRRVTLDSLMEATGANSERAAKLMGKLEEAGLIGADGLVKKQAVEGIKGQLLDLLGGEAGLKGLPPGMAPEARRAAAAARAAQAAAGSAGEGVVSAGGKTIKGLLPAGKGAAEAAAGGLMGGLKTVGKVAGRALPWALLAYTLYDTLVGEPREAAGSRAAVGLDMEGGMAREGNVQGMELEAKRRGEQASIGRNSQRLDRMSEGNREAELMSMVQEESGMLHNVAYASKPSIEEIYARMGAL